MFVYQKVIEKETSYVGWMRSTNHKLIGGLLFAGFQASKVVQDFLHPQYLGTVARHKLGHKEPSETTRGTSFSSF